MVVDSIKRSQSMWSFSQSRQYPVSASPDLLRSNSVVSNSTWSLSDGHTSNSRGFVGRFRKRGKNKTMQARRFTIGPCLCGDVDAVDSNGRSLLFYAARYGQTETAQQLIQAGCSPNQSDIMGNTALHEAIEKGHLDIADIFLKDGAADVNILGFNGETPLMAAVTRGQIDAVKLLDRYGADVNICDGAGNPPIYRAMQRGWNEIADFLLERQCDVNKTTANGMTCFFAAAHCNKIDITTISRRLLKSGYNFKMDADWLQTEGCPIDAKIDAKIHWKIMDKAGIKSNSRRKISLLSSGKRKLIKSFRRLSSTDSSRSDSS